ncbi:MAG: TonB-dependent receptor, partial [Rhodospirillales bacterium]|nr:TonB-dependent receptor [Rhodospirillales bacterium]
YNPNGRNVPTVVYGTSRNVAQIETQAVDLGVQYGTDTGVGYLSVRPQLSYAVKYDTQETEGAEVVDALGFLGDARGVLAPTMPKIRASIPIGLDSGNHSARLIARYTSGVTDRVGTVAIDPAAYLDFNYTWRPNDSFRLGFFIDNVTGELYLEQGAGTFLPPYERRFGAQLYWDLLE